MSFFRNPFTSFIFLFVLLNACVYAAEKPIRNAEFADSFYPSSASELKNMVVALLDNISQAKKETAPVALLVPHAGYAFSGKVAAAAYRHIAGHDYDTVILLGPGHHKQIAGAAVWDHGRWQTPLGLVDVDNDLAEKLIQDNDFMTANRDAHLGEHSLEVQLPFLQLLQKKFKILPIVMNDASQENCLSVARALAALIQGTDKKVLLIVSSDFSHYADLDETLKRDEYAFDAIRQKDSLALAKGIQTGKTQLCGHAAVLTLLEVLKYFEPIQSYQEMSDTSASVTGDMKRVVGYGAYRFDRSQQSVDVSGVLPQPLRKELLNIARQTLESWILNKKIPQFEITDISLMSPAAVFVTLNKGGELRGCMGGVVPDKPLYQAIQDRVIASAIHDPRFDEVRAEELDDIKIDISIIKDVRLISDSSEITVGKHGAMVHSKENSQGGLFLPEVATKYNLNREQFLELLCREKAGLSASCWQDPTVELYRFSTEEFGE